MAVKVVVLVAGVDYKILHKLRTGKRSYEEVDAGEFRTRCNRRVQFIVAEQEKKAQREGSGEPDLKFVLFDVLAGSVETCKAPKKAQPPAWQPDPDYQIDNKSKYSAVDYKQYIFDEKNLEFPKFDRVAGANAISMVEVYDYVKMKVPAGSTGSASAR